MACVGWLRRVLCLLVIHDGSQHYKGLNRLRGCVGAVHFRNPFLAPEHADEAQDAAGKAFFNFQGSRCSYSKIQECHFLKTERFVSYIYILYKTHPQTRSLVIRFANLASFDLANAECRKESDVKLVHTVIAQWYGRALEKLLIRSFASFLRCRSLCELCARPAARRDAGANHGQRLCRRLRSSTGSSHSSHPRFPCFSRALPPLDLTSCP